MALTQIKWSVTMSPETNISELDFSQLGVTPVQTKRSEVQVNLTNAKRNLSDNHKSFVLFKFMEVIYLIFPAAATAMYLE